MDCIIINTHDLKFIPVILVKICFEISKSYREFKKKSTLVENCKLVRATLGQIYLITKLSKVWPLQQYTLPKTWALGQPRVSELVLGPNKLSLFPLHISCATTYVAQTYVPEEYINYLPKMASSLKLFWVFQVCLHQSLTRSTVSLGTFIRNMYWLRRSKWNIYSSWAAVAFAIISFTFPRK